MNRMYGQSAIMMAAALLLIFSAPPLSASQTASGIAATARQTYIFKTFLRDDHIKIDAKNGNVTLTGSVADNFNKSLAGETLAGIPGVKHVDNKLEIKNALPSADSDAWIRDKVKGALLFHRSVSARKTAVNVQNGVVTLQGEATSSAQKNLTAEYAMDVEGVKDVHNEMTVTEPPAEARTVSRKIDDASITAQVKMTLLYHRSTSALNTRVETKRGVVTLHGKAKNAAEKDLAAKVAADVVGVKEIKNRMAIE